MNFRDRLLATLRAVEAVLEVPGVLVAGSEVPNLLEPGAASTLVVSQDVDLAIPIEVHADVRGRLSRIVRLVPSTDEPSVWVPGPDAPELIEVNFIGIDRAIVDPIDSYEHADDQLPLMVFGALSLLVAAPPLELEGLRIPVPRVAGLVLEKLATDRTGEKGDRDLLVVAGLLAFATGPDRAEIAETYRRLPAEMRHSIRTNLSILALLDARPAMPDPRPQRRVVAELLAELEPP